MFPAGRFLFPPQPAHAVADISALLHGFHREFNSVHRASNSRGQEICDATVRKSLYRVALASRLLICQSGSWFRSSLRRCSSYQVATRNTCIVAASTKVIVYRNRP